MEASKTMPIDIPELMNGSGRRSKAGSLVKKLGKRCQHKAHLCFHLVLKSSFPKQGRLGNTNTSSVFDEPETRKH